MKMLYLPQLAIAAWALYGRADSQSEDTRLVSRFSAIGWAAMLMLGLLMPLTIMASACGVPVSERECIVAILLTAVVSPLASLFLLTRVVCRARIPLLVLHVYNALHALLLVAFGGVLWWMAHCISTNRGLLPWT